VQLRGLYKKAERVYAAYNGKSVPGLAEWNQEEYEFCPVPVKGKRISPESRRTHIPDKCLLMYNTLRDHLPEAYAAIKQLTGLYISRNEFLSLLQTYYDTQGYLYPYSTTGNLPYMLLYLSENLTAYRRWIRKDSDLAKKLESVSDIKLIPASYRDEDGKVCQAADYVSIETRHFVKLSLMVWGHEYKLDSDGNLDESIRISLSKDIGTSETAKWETLAESKLQVDENYFGRLINSPKVIEMQKGNGNLICEGRRILKEMD